jgi:hypothetical protein
MMFFSTLLVVAATTLSMGIPTPSGPSPDNVYIAGMSYAGSGCPAGSVANVTDAGITLLYSDYVVMKP